MFKRNYAMYTSLMLYKKVCNYHARQRQAHISVSLKLRTGKRSIGNRKDVVCFHLHGQVSRQPLCHAWPQSLTQKFEHFDIFQDKYTAAYLYNNGDGCCLYYLRDFTFKLFRCWAMHVEVSCTYWEMSHGHLLF